MAKDRVYTSITARTAIAARERVVAELEELTGGKVGEARELIRELEELNEICKELDVELDEEL